MEGRERGMAAGGYSGNTTLIRCSRKADSATDISSSTKERLLAKHRRMNCKQENCEAFVNEMSEPGGSENAARQLDACSPKNRSIGQPLQPCAQALALRT